MTKITFDYKGVKLTINPSVSKEELEEAFQAFIKALALG